MTPATPLPTLPALRCLGDLADVRPVIVIDTREQTPLPFSRLASEPGTLSTGDYSFRGGEEVFAIERKTIADLVGCCVGDNRDRFFRELHRLRGYRFKRLLVIGTVSEIEVGTYRSSIAPAAVLATLRAIEARFDVPVVFAPTPAAAGREVETWAFWFARELIENVNVIARAHGLTRHHGKPIPALSAAGGGNVSNWTPDGLESGRVAGGGAIGAVNSPQFFDS